MFKFMYVNVVGAVDILNFIFERAMSCAKLYCTPKEQCMPFMNQSKCWTILTGQ